RGHRSRPALPGCPRHRAVHRAPARPPQPWNAGPDHASRHTGERRRWPARRHEDTVTMTTPPGTGTPGQRIFRQGPASVAVACAAPDALAHATATLYSYHQQAGSDAAWQLTVQLIRELPALPGSGVTTVEIGPGITARAAIRPGHAAFLTTEP